MCVASEATEAMTAHSVDRSLMPNGMLIKHFRTFKNKTVLTTAKTIRPMTIIMCSPPRAVTAEVNPETPTKTTPEAEV